MARLVTLTLLLIFAASVGVLALLSTKVPDLNLVPEIAKAVLQLGVVAIVGSAVSLLIFEYQREKGLADRQREEDRRSAEKQRDLDRVTEEKNRELRARKIEYREGLLLSVLAKALGAYSQAKKARRLLRARAIAQEGDRAMVLADGYDQYMELVNDAQLELENLARDVTTSGKAFSQHESIAASLRRMEVYLSELIGEYEKTRPLFAESVSKRPLRDHPLLEDFLRSASLSKFSPEVIHPYHEVQAAIRGDLLHPNFLNDEKDA